MRSLRSKKPARALQPAVRIRSASATHGHGGDKVTVRAVFKTNRKSERLKANWAQFEGVGALTRVRRLQQLLNCGVAALFRVLQRGDAVAVGEIHIGARGDQSLHNLLMGFAAVGED